MTEITRVPLQPVAKGAIGKLWLGVAALALAGAGVAWAALPPSVDVDTIRAGSGDMPTRSDVALINYKGTLANGKVFDQGERVPLSLDGVIPGFTKALEQMQRGGKYKVVIPSELGYGDKAVGEIPAGSDLTFEIELLDFRNRAELEEQQRMLQQLQQMQQGGMPGAPGAEGAPPPMPPQP